MIPLRRLLCKLAVAALSATPAAAASGTSPFGEEVVDLDDELTSDAPIDREHIEPDDAAFVIGRNLPLGAMNPLSATQLATTWALSSDPVRRAAIVYALEHSSPLGARTILDHLSQDPESLVRAAVVRVRGY